MEAHLVGLTSRINRMSLSKASGQFVKVFCNFWSDLVNYDAALWSAILAFDLVSIVSSVKQMI
jgi:hypothetical protein